MAATDFILDERIAATSIAIETIEQIEIRLVDDSRFFWLLFIPQIPDITEWHMLNDTTEGQLLHLVRHFSERLQADESADKLNIGALGNMVPQFHFHLVLRNRDDAAWPGPVWGCGAAVPLSDTEKNRRKNAVISLLEQLNR